MKKLVVSAAVLSLIWVARFASAGDVPPRSISVSGHCVRTVTPDRGSILVTVDVLDKDLKSATRQAAQTYERVKQAVEKLGLADLNVSTSEYSVREDRQWENQKPVFKGYRSRLGLKVVTSSIDKMGDVIALAAREGVQDVGALQTFLSEEKLLKEQMECLKQAAENARAKADRLAVSLNARVGDVLRVAEQGAGGPVMPRHEMSVMAMDGSPMAKAMPSPSIAAGTQTLELDVEVSFGIR
jgi:hypothetical protein